MPRNKSLLDSDILMHSDIIKTKSNICPNRIRVIRLINDMNIKDLAEKLHISTSMLQQIETQKKPISINILIAISDLFNVSSDYILYKSNQIKISDKCKELKTDISELKKYYKKGD